LRSPVPFFTVAPSASRTMGRGQTTAPRGPFKDYFFFLSFPPQNSPRSCYEEPLFLGNIPPEWFPYSILFPFYGTVFFLAPFFPGLESSFVRRALCPQGHGPGISGAFCQKTSFFPYADSFCQTAKILFQKCKCLFLPDCPLVLWSLFLPAGFPTFFAKRRPFAFSLFLDGRLVSFPPVPPQAYASYGRTSLFFFSANSAPRGFFFSTMYAKKGFRCLSTCDNFLRRASPRAPLPLH